MCTVGCFTDGHGRAARAGCPGLTRGTESSVHPCVPALRPADFPKARAGREGRVRFMARVAVRESVTLAGRAERARAARAFVSEMLGPGHPCGDVAVLLVSEVFK